MKLLYNKEVVAVCPHASLLKLLNGFQQNFVLDSAVKVSSKFYFGLYGAVLIHPVLYKRLRLTLVFIETAHHIKNWYST
jgi:hypothetical protein